MPYHAERTGQITWTDGLVVCLRNQLAIEAQCNGIRPGRRRNCPLCGELCRGGSHHSGKSPFQIPGRPLGGGKVHEVGDEGAPLCNRRTALDPRSGRR